MLKSLHRLSGRLRPISAAAPFLPPAVPSHLSTVARYRATPPRGAGWFTPAPAPAPIPDLVQAGHPVLHNVSAQVPVADIKSDRIQGIIDGMVGAMRRASGNGISAPEIGLPLRIIALEDTQDYIHYDLKYEDIKAQDRYPFELLVIVNPLLKKRSDKTALFFEGCLSVKGFKAMVERHLEVEVTGLDREGRPMKINATGWQARILQHECDHLDGTLYVDKIVPRTFRTIGNLNMRLPTGCSQLGVR